MCRYFHFFGWLVWMKAFVAFFFSQKEPEKRFMFPMDWYQQFRNV